MKVPTREQKFRIIFLNALIRPSAAAVLALTIIIGLTVSYWFLPVGLAFYATLVYLSMQDADESRKILNDTFYPERTRKLDLSKLQGGYREALQRAVNTRSRIQEAVKATTDPGTRSALEASTGDLDVLVGTAYDIALKAQDLQSAMQTANVSISALKSDVMELNNRIRQTEDEFSREQYKAALDGKTEQMKNYSDATDALNRWNAQLDNALSTLDTILSQVFRIRSSEVLSLSSATDQVSQSLKQEVEALRATSDALDTVYGLGK